MTNNFHQTLTHILSNQKSFNQQHLLYLRNERKKVFKLFKNYKQSKEKHISENEFLENNIKVIKQMIEINQIFFETLDVIDCKIHK